MARKQSTGRTAGITIVAWVIGLFMFFPIFWTAVAAFKTESDAYTLPQNFLTTPTRPTGCGPRAAASTARVAN